MCFGLVVNDGTITNNGILENHAEFYNYGTIQAGANSDYSTECYAIAQYDNDGYGALHMLTGSTITNNGEIDVNSTNSLHISGTVNNTGTIWVGKDAAGKMKVEAGGVLNNDYEDSSAGEIIIDSNSSMENIGKIFNYSIFENYAEFVNTGDFYNLYSVPYDGREM